MPQISACVEGITYLTRQKTESTIVKLLNNQILDFGHYYKFAQAKQVFEELDAFCRRRLRRYISRNKDSKNRESNLVLTNSVLASLGLKSLVEIYLKYHQKNKYKFRKKLKSMVKTGKSGRKLFLLELEKIEAKYGQKLILQELRRLTGLVAKLEKRFDKLEKKLDE